MPEHSFEEIQQGRRGGRQTFRDLKKHFVRVHGWLPVFRKYSDQTGKQVRYLTFCAKEAIDVRYFARKGVLARNAAGNEYPSLTFVESNEEDYAIIAETLGRVRLGIHGKFGDVFLDSQHPQHSELHDSFPYHVINLDFCGHIVPRSEHPYSETLKCISRVIESQAAKSQREWHLFLTFRAHQAHANNQANVQLKDIVEGNLTSQELKTAYGTKPSPETLLNTAYPEFLRIGIAKFLAYESKNHGYAMKMESSWIYKRNGDHGPYHIVKLVASLKSARTPGSIPNPNRENNMYSSAVKDIFVSEATDVDLALTTVSARRVIESELAPVLDELKKVASSHPEPVETKQSIPACMA